MKAYCVAWLLVGWLVPGGLSGAELKLPMRDSAAKSGGELAKEIETLRLEQREERIFFELIHGNIPELLRQFAAVNLTNVQNGKTNVGTFFAAPDYLSVGSGEDFFLTPLTPFTAQRIADALDCTLPTRKMVNAIYAAAPLKLAPAPIPPSPAMITVAAFRQHNQTVRDQRSALKNFPPGTLTAGHKKDVVISSRLATSPGKVAIYGWHQTNGTAIQPLYLGHAASWVDYSHGVRLVQKRMLVNGVTQTVDQVLASGELSGLLSDEGPVRQARYIFSGFPREIAKTNSAVATANRIVLGEFQKSAAFDEQTMLLMLDHGVRVVINAPSAEQLAVPRKMKLIFYGLPNGNTIEQAIGKKLKAGDDWHFNIQQIGAQTRFLRQRVTSEHLVVAYLENSLKSWPAWRKQFGDKAVFELVEKVSNRFEGFAPKIVLSAHSGGGSLIFGYLNSVEKIPDEVERLAFLDSNYGYETALHRDKLVTWLKRADPHFLIVLAYHDDIALLNGKTFVSAAGGTWGRSHLMKNDFDPLVKFTEEISPEFQRYFALDRRLQLLLKENPEKKILHTVQVEKNGFIHGMLSGTALENKGYEYFGEPVYARWIQSE